MFRDHSDTTDRDEAERQAHDEALADHYMELQREAEDERLALMGDGPDPPPSQADLDDDDRVTELDEDLFERGAFDDPSEEVCST